MAIRTTRWSPDTCACVMEYDWDDTQSEDTRVHSFARIVSRCPVHTEIPADEDSFNVVVGENKRKNDGWRFGTIRRPVLTEAEYTWRFTGTGANRQLFIRCIGATGQQRSLIQGDLNAAHGVGKVTVET